MLPLPVLVLSAGLVLADPGPDPRAPARAAPRAEAICFPVEVFTRDNCKQCDEAQKFLTELSKRRRNVRVTYHDVVADGAALKRLYALARQFGIQTPGVPGILVCNQFSVGYRDDQTTGRRIEELLTIEVFAREGCPHCAKAKEFLADLERRYPGLPVRVYDVFKDPAARNRMQDLAGRHRVQVPSLPMFSLYGRIIVGFRDAASTGREIESLVKNATTRCPADDVPDSKDLPQRSSPPAEKTPPAAQPMGLYGNWGVWWIDAICPTTTLVLLGPAPEPDVTPEEIPVPDEGVPPEAPQAVESTPQGQSARDEIDVPLFGKLRVSVLGMPAFTFLIGLLDGFNPCAMWVLIFLLSVLVNLKDRRKLLLIAGTFVVVSGLAYFAFMAAWLNVFLLIGLARGAQIALGVLAVVIGLVNVKDFVSFGRGFSFSIPESAKPGIYARVRQIMTAKYILVALTGAVVLAVLVNTIELLCTAGLPAMYTEILTFRNYPWWENYLYLGLYIVAYMFDDTIMLTIAVVTLSHRKLQEREGRWLKLASGLVILALGLTMLLKPDWLV
ncbi:MAG: glutaredoxin domain-containing protein [Deltaproteobacteria bacterium]